MSALEHFSFQEWIKTIPCLYCPSFQLSHSVVSNSLRPHGLQHARLPCPSQNSQSFVLCADLWDHLDAKLREPWCTSFSAQLNGACPGGAQPPQRPGAGGSVSRARPIPEYEGRGCAGAVRSLGTVRSSMTLLSLFPPSSQVFPELSKQQELDDLKEELDPSVRQKFLPREEPWSPKPPMFLFEPVVVD